MILVLILPLFSSLILDVLIGWLLTISGFVSVVGAFSLHGAGPFIREMRVALVALAAGFLIPSFPLQGLIALTVLVAVVLVLAGATQTAFATRPIPDNRGTCLVWRSGLAWFHGSSQQVATRVRNNDFLVCWQGEDFNL